MARGDDLINLIIALADMVGSKIVLLCTKTRQTPTLQTGVWSISARERRFLRPGAT